MFQKSFIQLGDSDLSWLPMGNNVCALYWPPATDGRVFLRYEYDESNRPVVNMSVTAVRPQRLWCALLRGLSVAQRSEDKRLADNKRVSFWLSALTVTSGPERKGMKTTDSKIPDSPQCQCHSPASVPGDASR